VFQQIYQFISCSIEPIIILGDLLQPLSGHDNSVVEMAFLPDGESAVTVAWDRNLIHWDLSTVDKIRQFTGHKAKPCAPMPVIRALWPMLRRVQMLNLPCPVR
jgi:WD40 repeat protein